MPDTGIGKEKVMKKLYDDLDRKSEALLLKQQLAEQVKGHTEISCAISDQKKKVKDKGQESGIVLPGAHERKECPTPNRCNKTAFVQWNT